MIIRPIILLIIAVNSDQTFLLVVIAMTLFFHNCYPHRQK